MPWVEEPAESPHPEIDRLYASGTPVPRIAELVRIREGTVRRHLERRRRVDPELAVARAAAPKGASVIFYRHRDELRDFVARHARFPRIRGTEDGERSLYVFLSEQRHAFLRQELGWERAAALGVLGDWVTTDDEVERERHWQGRLGEVVAFLAEQGRMPRHPKTTDPLEKTLGIWLATQNDLAHRGSILPDRLLALDAAVPGWRRGR